MPQLDVELTERCNNNCVHCCINRPANDRRAQRRELSVSQLDDVFKQAAALGCLTVRLTGGEPLLRPDFERIYLAARRRGMKVKLLTNACLLTPGLARLFRDVPPLEKISITAYGHDRKSYESVTRVPGSFARFERGLALLKEHGVPFELKGVIFRATTGHRKKLAAWIRRRTGAKPEMVTMLDLRHRRDSARRNERISRLRLGPGQAARIICADPLFRKQMVLFPKRYMGARGAKLFTCSAGKSVCLDAYGRLQPCLLLRKRRLTYDLGKGTLKDALTNFFPQALAATAKNKQYLDRCAKCGLKGFCNQCPAKSYIEYGVLDKPVEYLCRVAHAQAERLGWENETSLVR
ncbi:MAG TPA: radical SAM protein [Candidatus Edwardsbacteria bacterium]|nr:radical SAM protein [Candidatus Edwardsbacteria bacterium]